jgi:hypothetical protein
MVRNVKMLMWKALLPLIMVGSKGGSEKKAGVLIYAARRTLAEIVGARKREKEKN